jgi:hypothetical protein
MECLPSLLFSKVAIRTAQPLTAPLSSVDFEQYQMRNAMAQGAEQTVCYQALGEGMGPCLEAQAETGMIATEKAQMRRMV